MAANLCLDLIELTDTLQQIGGERGRLGRMNVEYLAPEMRPASNLGDTVGVVELVIAGIAIGLQIAGETGQLPLGMCTGPIGGELVPDQRRRGGAAAAIVDGVSPEPASRRLATSRIEHGDRRKIGQIGRAQGVERVRQK